MDHGLDGIDREMSLKHVEADRKNRSNNQTPFTTFISEGFLTEDLDQSTAQGLMPTQADMSVYPTLKCCISTAHGSAMMR